MIVITFTDDFASHKKITLNIDVCLEANESRF